MKLALNSNAAALVFVHNHPSGDPQPSAEDRNLTRNLVFASQLLSLQVLDHIIIGYNRYYSFADEGVIKLFTEEYRTKLNL
jgi:DNA repair protein RadC